MTLMTPVELGKLLIKTGELDPVYIMLVEARKAGVLTQIALEKWCVAYWVFYHPGAVSKIVEAKDFWQACKDHAAIQAGARGSHRRHFRAAKALKALEELSAKHETAKAAIRHLTSARATSNDVISKALEWPQFGPWIAFKVADMLDRVLGIPLDFSDCRLDIYEVPLKGGVLAELLSRRAYTYEGALETYAGSTHSTRRFFMDAGMRRIIKGLAKLKAPPYYDRAPNIQEAETIACAYQGYLSGSYQIGSDIRWIRQSLSGWGKLADKLEKFLPADLEV